MNVLTTMTGSFNGCGLGWSLCSLDFNGDGIKDLVALEKNWNPDCVMDYTNRMFGRINFYWGRTNFNNTISASIPGTYQRQYGLGRIFNAGDVNGDGIEDLGYWGSESQLRKVLIFFGRQQPSPTPDRVYNYPNNQYMLINKVYPLGDINNDGYAEIGVSVIHSDNTASILVMAGVTGNAITLLHPVGTDVVSSINGIGDVNNDGIDDYHIMNPLTEHDNSQQRLSVHFGGNSFPIGDSLVISPNANSLIFFHACPLGDVNGDGIADFSSFMNSSGNRIWYGSSNLSPQWNIMLPAISTGDTDNYTFVHGDLNNDGYEDLIAANYMYAGQDGRAYVWMGGNNFNNTLDLTLYAPPGVSEKFGWAKAAGDFNNDGFCDVAISQPISDSGPETAQGRIHVYAGNAQLADTTVSNEDFTIPNPETGLKVTIFPNPCQTANNNITFRVGGLLKNEVGSIEIYNIKGQKVFQSMDVTLSAKSSFSTIQLRNMPSGLYLCHIRAAGKVIVKQLSIVR